jgi:DNA (cytosine-5)-methyltransferase 1
MGKTVNSFFCGAGGFDLGFIQAGFDIVGAWDFDKYAVKSYSDNISDHVKQMDITVMTGEDVPTASGWLFGFPCTDISYAGKQAGMIKGETRSGLFFEVMRLLGEVEQKPDWILAENVKAVGKLIPEIEYEYDKAGYRLVYTMYNSKFHNLPQSRERFFLLGIRKDLDLDFVFPEQQTAFVPKLSSILDEEVDEKFYIDSDKAAKVIEQAKQRVKLEGVHACITPDRVEKRQNGRRAKENEAEMYTLTAQDMHGIIVLGRAEGINGHDILKRVYSVDGVSPTLNTCGGGNTQPKILEVGSLKPDHCTRSGQRDVVWDAHGIAGTLMSSDYKQPRPILHEYRVRKLTPNEYKKLQGFPSWYKQTVSNSQFYKQMGNAVSVPVSHFIAKAISEQL